MVTENGSPPQVRSGRLGQAGAPAGPRVTSAGAERTAAVPRRRPAPTGHLRGCGADLPGRMRTLLGDGSPPQVRSGPVPPPDRRRLRRVTSAGAERTAEVPRVNLAGAGHLRRCGADKSVHWPVRRRFGSPPRVRSGRRPPGRLDVSPRVTSAGAERTCPGSRSRAAATGHLRGCGADRQVALGRQVAVGSPPRVRSGRALGQVPSGGLRVTSAGAERTRAARTSPSAPTGHLRGCGADVPMAGALSSIFGSPPQVRSGPGDQQAERPRARVTSQVRSGRGTGRRGQRPSSGNLRGCGADPFVRRITLWRDGSPPQVRSGQLTARTRRGNLRVTSAGAERTGPRPAHRCTRSGHLRGCGVDAVNGRSK